MKHILIALIVIVSILSCKQNKLNDNHNLYHFIDTIEGNVILTTIYINNDLNTTNIATIKIK